MKQQIQKNYMLAVRLDEMQIKPKSVPGSANQTVFKDNYVDSRAITIFKHDSTLCAYSQSILWKLNRYMYHISEDCSTFKIFTVVKTVLTAPEN